MGFVSFMQGIEWLLWRHQTCDTYHKTVSLLGFFLNGLQPFVLGALVIIFTQKNVFPILCTLFIYSLITALYAIQYTSDLHCTIQHKGDPHLLWNWTIMPYYVITWITYITSVMIICMLGMPTMGTAIFSATGMLLTMIASIILYPRQHMGAMWCYFSTFLPIIYYTYRSFI